jgi:hypothetical protein
MERGSVALCEPIFGVKKGHGAPFASIYECGTVAVSIINPSMPLGLAGFRELILRPAAAAAVRPFYSNFDWLEGLASWPATNLLPYLA